MTREEAEEYAKGMTYRDAINNLMKARSIPYRKATFIKIKELLKALEQEPKTGHWIVTDDDLVYCSECEDSYYPRPIDASWYYCPHCGAKME